MRRIGFTRLAYWYQSKPFPPGWRAIDFDPVRRAWVITRVWWWPVAVAIRWWNVRAVTFFERYPREWRGFR